MLEKIWNMAGEFGLNFLKLALPYWMIRELDHLKLLTLYVVLILTILGSVTLTGVVTGSEAIETSKSFVEVALMLVVFSMASSFLIHGFVPNPANRDEIRDRTALQFIQDLAVLILSICFFSMLMSELLQTLRVYELTSFRNWPAIEQFIRANDLSVLQPILNSFVATLLVVSLVYMKHTLIDRKRNPQSWDNALRLRSLGPCAFVTLVICSVFTGVMNYVY